MKHLLIGLISLLSMSSFKVESKTYVVPKVEGIHEYYEARHASPLSKEKIMAKISCESDYNSVCKAINPESSYARDIECLDEEYGLVNTVVQIAGEYILDLAIALENLMLGPEEEVRRQSVKKLGETRYFFNISEEDIKLEVNNVMSESDREYYPKDKVAQYIFKITCE